MKNLLSLFCFLMVLGLAAQDETYEWEPIDTSYHDSFEFETPELPPLPDLSISFYAPLQTKQHTYTFDIPILNKGVQATQACELKLIHTWVDAQGQQRKINRVETIPALVPGQLYTLRINLRDATFRQLGHQTKSTFIQIDPIGRIAEQDEANNTVRFVPGQYVLPETIETELGEEYYETNNY